MAPMGSEVRLLGPPLIQRDGGPQRLSGRKAWGLLAYLLLETRPPTRRELAEHLTNDTNDPLASLRWHLLQVRRAIEPSEVVEAGGRLTFRPSSDTSIDVHEVFTGAVDPDRVQHLCTGDLLEGIAFDDLPTFDMWLSLQRARVTAACADILRWSAITLSRSKPSRALSLIGLGLLRDPFDDALHQLAVETHVALGDHASADGHIERVKNLYREELGTEPSASILGAIQPARARPNGFPVPDDVTAETLIEVAQARLADADFERALDTARRAVSAAAASGDGRLEARALMTLAGALIHTIHGRDHESFALLARAQKLATELEDPLLLADIERECGFVWMIDARYGAAETCLTRSMRWAVEGGSSPLSAMARTFRAICESDRTDYARAEKDLQVAMADLAPEEYRGFRGYARATLARSLILTGRVSEARAEAQLALEELETGGMHGSVPWGLAQIGEATLLSGERVEAEQIFERAFALGLEFADPCWESMAQRGLALCALHEGRCDDARGLLANALARARRESDTYHWAEAQILTELVELEEGSDLDHVRDAMRLALAGPMPDFAERLSPYAGALQTRPQTPSS
jgi:DNA-binding SARP family transcriptional activator